MLCEVCENVDFQSILKNGGSTNLGSLAVIFKKDFCSFCRLVIANFKEQWLARHYSELSGMGDSNTSTGHCFLSQSSDTDENRRRSYSLGLTVPLDWEVHGDGPPEVLIGEVFMVSNDAPSIGFGNQCNARLLEPYVDLVLVKEWLSRGQHKHNLPLLAANPRRRTLPDGFRVIDTYDMCLKDSHAWNSDYFALSYVWGSATMLKTLLSNYNNFHLPGAFCSENQDIPAVVTSAMVFVKSLGFRYLWVDALCIIQDDDKDRENQISSMDVIYRCAYATIIAASGTSANDPLPGVPGAPRSTAQVIEEVKGIRYTSPKFRLYDALTHSLWNSRGWTYQERMLSPQHLYLFHDQAIYLCRDDSFSDWYEGSGTSNLQPANADSFVGAGSVNSLIGKTDPGTHYEAFLSYFSDTVYMYTARQFTWTSDILHAFNGIAAAYSEAFGWTIKEGLPIEMIQLALLWEPVDTVQKREREPMRNGHSKSFSTWSWAGWLGRIQYRRLAESSIARSEITHLRVEDETHKLQDISNDATITLSCSVLQFQSLSAVFTVSHQDAIAFPTFGLRDTHSRDLCVRIYDNTRKYCGVAFSVSWPEESPESQYECVLVSRSRHRAPVMNDRAGRTRHGKAVTIRNYEDAKRYMDMADASDQWPKGGPPTHLDPTFKDQQWCNMNVIIAKQSLLGGYYERVAIGQIHEDAWKSASTCRKLFKFI